MRNKAWFWGHALLTCICVVCCVAMFFRDSPSNHRDSLNANADFALRHFHQVRWLGGDYELPEGIDHCGVAILRFVDGRFDGREAPFAWSPPSMGSRVVPYMVMWGPTHRGMERVVVSQGGWTGAGSHNDWFAKMNGTLSTSAGTHDFGEIRGYRVIGLAASQAPNGWNGFGDLELTLKNCKYVSVLGVRPFSTEEEDRHWAYVLWDDPD